MGKFLGCMKILECSNEGGSRQENAEGWGRNIDGIFSNEFTCGSECLWTQMIPTKSLLQICMISAPVVEPKTNNNNKKKTLLCNLVLGKDKLFLKQLELNESLDSLSPLYLQ